MSIKPPPPADLDAVRHIAATCPEKLDDYLRFFHPTDQEGRYLPFDELRHRIAPQMDHRLVWSMVKLARERQSIHLMDLGSPATPCQFVLTRLIQKAISETDRNATTASLEWMGSKIGEKARMEFLLADLIEDESISSSQLEGAATTTGVAKDLLKRQRKPRNADEKMIVGNFKMMKFAWEQRGRPLSIELIREMHNVGVEGIDDDAYSPGHFRITDDVHVIDASGNIVHSPPPADRLANRITAIADWINHSHDDLSGQLYIHPLIKAMTLHFCIGFEHPFRDGNGRVARALFYWYLFKHDFAAFRYIAISVLLKKAPVKYGKSYLYTETDGMDLTYFLEYQSGVIIRAIDRFQQSYRSAAQEIEQFNRWLWESGLYNKLSDRQRAVFQVAKGGSVLGFTIRSVERNLGCSYNTAAAVLNGLVDMKLFVKVRKGREWLYFMEKKNRIIHSWSH